MNNRLITVLFAASVFTLFADKKLSLHNTDTDESFEISVPNRLNIYEYNVNWLDSVPYLIEHAQWKEPWAYEALAECYRYGKGGIEKSMFNALLCYDEAGMSAIKIAEDAYEANHFDELGLINHLMDGLENLHHPEDETISIIEGLPSPAPRWATLLKDILKQEPDNRQKYIESRLSPELDCDEFLIGFAYLVKSNPDAFNTVFIGSTNDEMDKIRIFGEKLPMLYDIAATGLWKKYTQYSNDSTQHLAHALTCMYHADKAGFLSKGNMALILTYCEEHGKDDKVPFSDEDLARFDKICPKDYRNHLNPFGMEIEESPVELIEEIELIEE